ncbi:hypothetical protein BDW02DRAFT_40534 [Decorospora gaudefroyi]|uniref:Rhodopsin domain-containing protein n=1 Tax=Decorospora gaudefroyi TaxID=184978 RepID=A0A6A5K4N4_9PLEO|nr:hypothetical protein BDW02DRAFT_40534 [Decorospora gaudefroyi]
MAGHSATEIARSGKQQERITIAFLTLAWFFILLRIWTRTCVISNFGWDDSIMILAGLIFTVYCAATLYIEANGGGTHITEVVHLQLLTKWAVASEACYVLTMMVLKISLGIFFARIVVQRWHLMSIYVTVGVNIFSSAAAFFYVFFRCGANLDKYVVHQLAGRCTPHRLDLFMAYQQAAFTTLTDLLFLTLPVLILWNANMDRRSKISIGFILCLAALGCICSTIRFRYIDGLTQIDDFFWNVVNISIWSTIEAGACTIAGCLATLRPLFKRAVRQARESTVLSGCVKQISRSLRSGSHSRPNSDDPSCVPHSKTAASNPKSQYYGADRKTPATRATAEPEFFEYLVPPGSEVIPLSSDLGTKRSSTEPILGRSEPTPFFEPHWPHRPKAYRTKHERKRQSLHGSWALQRGTADDGRTFFERPISAPVSPDSFRYIGEAV